MAVEDSGILFRWLRGDGIAETRCNGVEEVTDEPDGRVGDTPFESLGEIVDESKVS